MKSHTINILKLCWHSGIANHSITHSISLIKKELKACVQSFSFFHQVIAFKVGLSTLKKKMCCLLHGKPVRNDEECFSFHLKSSFRSQDI